MRKIAYTATATKALKRRANRAAAIRATVAQYAVDSASLANNVITLTGVDAKRLRVGDYRGIFVETVTTVTVLDIGPRADIYD